MARRIPFLALILAGNLAAQEAVPLAGYSFDDGQIETGPDTFRVFQGARGQVSLDSAIHYSGYYSLRLQDAAGDADFPELQGYFPLRQTGVLRFHFALLVTDPAQTLNIALAGPQGFALRRNGIGFWLSVRDGRLSHTTDSIPKAVLTLAAFAWYVVDVRFDIAAGRYDLRITDNGETVVDIKNVANAANQPGSGLDKFSFVGDVEEDKSNAVYFVDDVWIAADGGSAPAAFAAPGRRKLFIDRWQAHQRQLRARPGCIAANGVEDFGLSPHGIRGEFGDAAWRAFADSLNGPAAAPLPAVLEQWRSGIAQWQAGCRQLQAGQGVLALADFDAASAQLPASPLLALNKAQALALLQRWKEVDLALAQCGADFMADPRYGVAAGQIAFARRDDGQHQEEQKFFGLLWQERHSEAMAYAQDRAAQPAVPPNVRAVWTERMGDAAFLAGWRAEATQAYQASLDISGNRARALEKLSDLAYLAGDVEAERRYREAVYGSLRKTGNGAGF